MFFLRLNFDSNLLLSFYLLLLYFLLVPFLLLSSQSDSGYWAIPITLTSAFLFLGIEAAASDVDVGPFLADRINHVDVDGLVIRVEEDVEQVLKALYENDERVKTT